MTRTKNSHSHAAERPAGLGARAKARLERVAIVAGVFLPVPLLAATGLSIPLPSVVERLAAGLVPWAEAATFTRTSFTTGANGQIIFAPSDGAAPAEPPASAPAPAPAPPRAVPDQRRPVKIAGPRSGDRVGAATPISGDAPSAGPTAATPREAPASQAPAPGPAPSPGDSRPATDDSAQPPPPPSEDPKPPAPGNEPKPPSEPEPVTAPVEDAVEDVADEVEPVVEKVEDTVEDTVKDPVGTVTGLPPIR